jgi:sRNA-binding regulator protein Hfq
MNETSFIDNLVDKGQPVIIRLLEGKDIMAIPVAHDGETIIIKKNHSEETSMIYKRAISVITPAGG